MDSKIARDWTTEAGLRAVVLRAFGTHNCGYVNVGDDHPLYRHPDSKPHPALRALWEEAQQGPIGKRGVIAIACAKPGDGGASPDAVFDVHGSLTFAGPLLGLVGDESLWWYGFDCDHLGDTLATCNEEFCVAECESLARQLAAVPRPAGAGRKPQREGERHAQDPNS